MMKVLYVLSRDDKFGAPRALMEMVSTLKEKYNIEPVILTPVKNRINEQCDKLNIENYHIPYGTAMKIKNDYFNNILRWLLYKYGNIVSLRRISKKIDISKIDLIHTNNSVIDFGYRISKRNNINHIFHIREFADLDFNYFPFDKNSINYMNDSNNIAISSVINNHWSNKNVKNIRVIYDGIDLDTIEPKKKYNSKKIKFLFIGALCEGKGQMDFLNAIVKLDKEKLSNIEIHFYGTGDNNYIQQIKDFVNKNNLNNNIFLEGYKENVRSVIKDYDVGIINSKSEAFGRVTVEYMATGLCVLASNTGANIELIKNNKTGILFDYKNYDDICEKINYILNNKEIIKKIGVAARSDVLKKYSKEKNAENVYNLYKEIKGEK